MPRSDVVGKLGMQAFRRDKGERDWRILSVFAIEADPRHMVQQCAFTLHGRADALDAHPKAGKFLQRIRIPSTAKAGLREVLNFYGVTRASLLPDLRI